MFSTLGISQLVDYARSLGITINTTYENSSYVEFKTRTIFISASDSLLVDGNFSVQEIYQATFSHEIGHLFAYIETAEGDADYDHYCERTAWSLGEDIYKQVYGEAPSSFYEIKKQCLLSHGYWREA